MDIRKAILLAQQKGVTIVRDSWREEGIEFAVLATNTSDCCLLIPRKEKSTVGRRWNPTMDDLTADDWKIY